jgi:hypothetical protein
MLRGFRGEADCPAARPLDRVRLAGDCHLVDRRLVFCRSLVPMPRIGEAVRGLLAAATLVFALVVMACLATPRRWLALAAYAASFALFLAWWATIKPTNDRNWAPDVARTVTATINGDRLIVKNVRNFTWRSDTDFDQRWEQRTYDLSHVHDVDLIMSYWAGAAGLRTLVAEVLPENTPMLQLFKTSGLPLSTSREGQVVHVKICLS